MRDIRKFSGRHTDVELTEFINERILQGLAIEPGDRLVDIGCGDGTLLRLAMRRGLSNVVGLSGSEEEAALLRKVGFNVTQAFTHSLPLSDHCASIVVCNGVLHMVPPDKIPASLREIARISQKGARIWIGEIPRVHEPWSIREFANYPAMLWWLLQKRGLRTFLGMCRRLLTGQQREPVLRTPLSFWSAPDAFIQMAYEAGLRVEQHSPHQTFDPARQPSVSPTREDYLLRAETAQSDVQGKLPHREEFTPK
jgi:SAM-dependent methyltransferase